MYQLQQPLPFTVLKHYLENFYILAYIGVATALTVYGIETLIISLCCLHYFFSVATALTVYGIETPETRTTNF